ncbi:MAG: LegC family aminotransferase [Rikenellaceae bacterium]
MDNLKLITDKIHQIYGTEEFVALHSPCFMGNERKYLNDCIDSTYVSSVGVYVDKFEQMITEYTGAKAAVACVNGTNALHMAMMLVGVEKGDEVLTQAVTFIATCNAISYISAEPVFIDVDLDTMGLSPVALSSWLKANAEVREGQCFNRVTKRRIKACVPMHTFGHPCKIDKIVEICSAYHIEVVEDAAESLGSFYKEKHTGTFAKVGVISFNGNKTITTGGGGMMIFQDEKLAKLAKHLTTQSKIPHKWEFVHDNIGYNYRMPNINAALGCAQIENIENFVRNKRETANMYQEFFEKIDSIDYFTEPENCRSNYWLHSIILKDRSRRDQFLEFTNSNGVMTRPIWTLMSKLSMFGQCQNDGLKNSLWLEDRVVNTPSSVRLTEIK